MVPNRPLLPTVLVALVALVAASPRPALADAVVGTGSCWVGHGLAALPEACLVPRSVYSSAEGGTRWESSDRQVGTRVRAERLRD
jgi:hypothetical protein